MGHRGCRIRLPESFLDVHGGQFNDVCRRPLYGCVHRLALGLLWGNNPGNGVGLSAEFIRALKVGVCGGGWGVIYMSLHMGVCVGYPR